MRVVTKSRGCEGLSDAQCLYADHFFMRLSHWRDPPIDDRLCLRLARNDVRAKYPFDEWEHKGVDEYLRERAKVGRSAEAEPARVRGRADGAVGLLRSYDEANIAALDLTGSRGIPLYA